MLAYRSTPGAGDGFGVFSYDNCRTSGCTRGLRRITWLMRSGNRRENRVHGKSMCGDAAVGKRSTRPPSGF